MYQQTFKLCLLVLVSVLLGLPGMPVHAQQADVNAADEIPDAAPRKLFHPNAAPAAKAPSSKDFYEAHKSLAKKKVQKAVSGAATSAKTSAPAVEANDLMDAMRQNLEQPPQQAAPQTAAVPEAVAKSAPANTPVDAPKALPPITQKATAAAPTAAAPMIQEVKKAAEPVATPAKEAIAAAAPKKDDSKSTGAPMLSDLAEAPDGAEDVKGPAPTPAPAEVKPVATPEPQHVQASVAEAKTVDTPQDGFAKSRPLFSSRADKRKRPGIHKVTSYDPSVMATAQAESLPPIATPPASDPHQMIKPVGEEAPAAAPAKKSIWGAPTPDMSKGKVLYTQTADGQVSTEPKAEVKTAAAPESKAEEPAGEVVATQTADSDEVKAAPVAPVQKELASPQQLVANPDIGTCGSAQGIGVSSAPTANLCASGTATTVIGSGPFIWSCQGEHGAHTVNCSAPLKVNGDCGAADGVASATPPSTNLCRAGEASAVSGKNPYTWTCGGIGGGVNASCLAPLPPPKVEVVEKPVEPTPPPTITAKSEAAVASKSGECTPVVKRWTITCQQGGYPSNYKGVIVGETQILCPTAAERGVWLSNNCMAATETAPVSPVAGKPVQPPKAPRKSDVADMLPDIEPLPVAKLDAPRKLFTPRYKGGAAGGVPEENVTTINFAPNSEGLDGNATSAVEGVINGLHGDDKSIITLNAYGAVPSDGDTQEARRIALARALSVRSYLMRRGIPSSRIDVRAVGPSGDDRSDDRVDIKVK